MRCLEPVQIGIATTIICCKVEPAQACDGERLQEVACALQIIAHSARTFSMPRNRNYGESARLFDLSEHRFHHLLSQSVGRFEAAIVDFLSYPLGQRSADFSVLGCRVLSTSGRDIASIPCASSAARLASLQ